MQFAAVCAHCRICGGEIFAGQIASCMPGETVCPVCRSAYARTRLFPDRFTAWGVQS